jgi:hypothetical protein
MPVDTGLAEYVIIATYIYIYIHTHRMILEECAKLHAYVTKIYLTKISYQNGYNYEICEIHGNLRKG